MLGISYHECSFDTEVRQYRPNNNKETPDNQEKETKKIVRQRCHKFTYYVIMLHYVMCQINLYPNGRNQ